MSPPHVLLPSSPHQHQHLARHLKHSSLHSAPCRTHAAVLRRRQTRCKNSSAAGSSSSNNGYDYSYQQQQQQQQQQGPDMVGGILSSCLSATARLSDAVVGRLADALQSVAPAQAPRHKIEVSVKGALVLLLLGLLKGVISFVLLVGCVGLAAYTATQVFGWHGVVLSHTGQGYGGGNNRQPPPQYPPLNQEEYQQQQARRMAQTAYRQQQWQQQQQQARGWPGRQGGRGPAGDQDDVVDVFHFGRPAPQ